MAREYAFLMINYDTPELIKDIQNKLTDDELYIEEGEHYGIEGETHVTLVPCLDNSVDVNELRTMLQPLDKYTLMLNNVSMFTNNENYDVLKCDANSFILNDTNKRIREKFPSYSEYTDYHPHVTIAYLKKNMGEQYLQEMLSPLIILKPTSFHFSYVDKDGNEKDLYFK